MAQRNRQQLTQQYQIEKELAAKLRAAEPLERRKSYTTVYDELFRRVPHHPQWTLISNPKQTQRKVSRQLSVLKRYLDQDSVFLEIGAGDCALARHADSPSTLSSNRRRMIPCSHSLPEPVSLEQ